MSYSGYSTRRAVGRPSSSLRRIVRGSSGSSCGGAKRVRELWWRFGPGKRERSTVEGIAVDVSRFGGPWGISRGGIGALGTSDLSLVYTHYQIYQGIFARG